MPIIMNDYNADAKLNDFIDISHMRRDEYEKHMKDLQSRSDCPCARCTPSVKKSCGESGSAVYCTRYQKWRKYYLENAR